MVFCAGFLLGAIRTVWIVPLVGVRYAELMESPIMLAVTVWAARRISRRGLDNPLGVGLIGLGFLLAAEVAVAAGVRHLSLREYIANRDPVSGTVYIILLAAFAVMPFVMETGSREGPGLLHAFLPNPDVRERHEITVGAPAAMVLEVARNLDIQTLAAVRAIFWLRAKLLGAKSVARPRRGFLADMADLGWTVLAERETYVVMGAACQPWKADVKFSSIPPGEFATFAEPDQVKIAWTLEAEALGSGRTRFATETRAVATEAASRTSFRAYWRKFRIGIVMIRRLLLSGVRREAEARMKAGVRK